MKYTVTVEIEAPLEKVISLFDDPDNWAKWRDGFVSAETLRGSAGAEGGTDQAGESSGRQSDRGA